MENIEVETSNSEVESDNNSEVESDNELDATIIEQTNSPQKESNGL